MDKFLIKSFLKSLRSARKANFKFVCSTINYRYKFDIKRDSGIAMTIEDLINKFEVTSVYQTVDEIFLYDGEYKVEFIEETILTPSNTNYQQTKIYCKEDVQVFLPIFRLLNEQVVFVLKTPKGYKQMYFINGKVLFEDIFDGYLTLYMTDLRKVFSIFPNAEIVMFDRLPTRTSFKSITLASEEKAKSLDLKYRQERNNLTIAGDLYVNAR